MVNNLIGDIEKKHRNTTICSFFENLEVRSTMFHPKLAKPSPSIDSMDIFYNETKYDINTTQNITTMRSKKLYELREKISKYTPKSI
jgi:hypothetical protein